MCTQGIFSNSYHEAHEFGGVGRALLQMSFRYLDRPDVLMYFCIIVVVMTKQFCLGTPIKSADTTIWHKLLLH